MISLPVTIPNGFSIVVKKDDPVTIGQIIAEKQLGSQTIINIAEILAISPTKAKKILKKNPGDTINSGDVIAIKKSFLGLNKAKLISKIAGTIVRYERETANLIVDTTYQTLTKNIVSPVEGTVSLCDNEKIVINTDKNIIYGKKGRGENKEAEVFILEESFAQESNESEQANLVYLLDGRAIGKVVVTKQLSKDILLKGIGLGVAGLIATSVEDGDIAYIESKNFNLPVMEIEPEAIQKLFDWKGKKIYLEGAQKTIILLHS